MIHINVGLYVLSTHYLLCQLQGGMLSFERVPHTSWGKISNAIGDETAARRVAHCPSYEALRKPLPHISPPDSQTKGNMRIWWLTIPCPWEGTDDRGRIVCTSRSRAKAPSVPNGYYFHSSKFLNLNTDPTRVRLLFKTQYKKYLGIIISKRHINYETIFPKIMAEQYLLITLGESALS